MSDVVQTFTEITGGSVDDATKFLSICDFDVGNAVQLYFAAGEGGGSSSSSSSSSSSTGRGPAPPPSQPQASSYTTSSATTSVGGGGGTGGTGGVTAPQRRGRPTEDEDADIAAAIAASMGQPPPPRPARTRADDDDVPPPPENLAPTALTGGDDDDAMMTGDGDIDMAMLRAITGGGSSGGGGERRIWIDIEEKVSKETQRAFRAESFPTFAMPNYGCENRYKCNKYRVPVSLVDRFDVCCEISQRDSKFVLMLVYDEGDLSSCALNRDVLNNPDIQEILPGIYNCFFFTVQRELLEAVYDHSLRDIQDLRRSPSANQRSIDRMLDVSNLFQRYSLLADAQEHILENIQLHEALFPRVSDAQRYIARNQWPLVLVIDPHTKAIHHRVQTTSLLRQPAEFGKEQFWHEVIEPGLSVDSAVTADNFFMPSSSSSSGGESSSSATKSTMASSSVASAAPPPGVSSSSSAAPTVTPSAASTAPSPPSVSTTSSDTSAPSVASTVPAPAPAPAPVPGGPTSSPAPAPAAAPAESKPAAIGLPVDLKPFINVAGAAPANCIRMRQRTARGTTELNLLKTTPLRDLLRLLVARELNASEGGIADIVAQQAEGGGDGAAASSSYAFTPSMPLLAAVRRSQFLSGVPPKPKEMPPDLGDNAALTVGDWNGWKNGEVLMLRIDDK